MAKDLERWLKAEAELAEFDRKQFPISELNRRLREDRTSTPMFTALVDMMRQDHPEDFPETESQED
jgi:hypothetical protein